MSPFENTGRTAKQSSGANGKQEPFHLYLFVDEREHFFIVHQRLLPMTTRDKQNIKGPRFRDGHVRSKP